MLAADRLAGFLNCSQLGLLLVILRLQDSKLTLQMLLQLNSRLLPGIFPCGVLRLKGSLQICHVFAFLFQQDLVLLGILCQPSGDLVLNCLDRGFKRAVKVLLLLDHLVPQGEILRLDALDEDVREFTHIP